VFLPKDRDYNNQVEIKIGKHNDIDLKTNIWNTKLPSELIYDNKTRIMHNLAREFIMDKIIDYFDKRYDIDMKI